MHAKTKPEYPPPLEDCIRDGISLWEGEEEVLDQVIARIRAILTRTAGYMEDSIDAVGPNVVETYATLRHAGHTARAAFADGCTQASTSHGMEVVNAFVAQCRLHAALMGVDSSLNHMQELVDAVHAQEEGGVRYLVDVLLRTPPNKRDQNWTRFMDSALEALQEAIHRAPTPKNFWLCSDVFFSITARHKQVTGKDKVRNTLMRALVSTMAELAIRTRIPSFLWTSYVQALVFGYPRPAVLTGDALMAQLQPFTQYGTYVRGVLSHFCVPNPQRYSAFGPVYFPVRTPVHEHCLALLEQAEWALGDWGALASASEGSADGVRPIVAEKVERLLIARYGTFLRSEFPIMFEELAAQGMTFHAYVCIITATRRNDLRTFAVWACERSAYAVPLAQLPIYFASVAHEAWWQMVARVFDTTLLSLQEDVEQEADSGLSGNHGARYELERFFCSDRETMQALHARVWSAEARDFLARFL